jgi:5-methylcytosine-specific restriction endonuclease McrA
MSKTLAERREYQREYMRKYNASEKGAEYNRRHVKEWRDKGNRKPEKRRMTREYREIILGFLLERDGHICALCNETLVESRLSIDHIIPHALGGENKMENLRAVHFICNASRGTETRKIIHGY